MTKETIHTALADFKNALNLHFGGGIDLIIFGSAAREDFDSESDIDVLVLLPFEPGNDLEEKIFNIAFDIELQLGIVFGVIVYSKDFWNSTRASAMPLHENISREGMHL